MTSRQTPEFRADDAAPPVSRDRARGIRAAVLGGVIMVLAPLFGFLGGSMTGGAGAQSGPDPLVVWLTGGLVIGGFGGIVAILGVLRWTRSSAQERPRTARP